MEYIMAKKTDGCLFCTKFSENDDEKNFILKRSVHNYAILNTYPYTNGHIIIASNKHISSVENMDNEELLDFMSLTKLCISCLKTRLCPEGFNLGANLGRAAGAGVEGHFHMHIVPRWHGDTNFMPLISEARVIPEHLSSTYRKLLSFFKAEIE